jgi:hypothetical protein
MFTQKAKSKITDHMHDEMLSLKFIYIQHMRSYL